MKTSRLFLPMAMLLLTGSSTPAACCSTNTAPSCHSRAADQSVAYTDKSIYHSETTWTSDTGKRLPLGALAGQPQVVTIFFANCRYACPMIVNDMKRIAAALPAGVRQRVGFTLASFDTENDTPTKLAAFRQIRGLPATNWTLLHGANDDVLELAALLGVKYKRDADGQFSHSNVITVLNAEGEIVHQQFGLNQDPTETVRHLEALLATPTAKR